MSYTQSALSFTEPEQEDTPDSTSCLHLSVDINVQHSIAVSILTPSCVRALQAKGNIIRFVAGMYHIYY